MQNIKNTIELFKVVYFPDMKNRIREDFNLKFIDRGVILDFIPTTTEESVIEFMFPKIQARTLFSVEERRTSTVQELLTKQFLNYIETYGVGLPGLFDLECNGGNVKVPITYISGVTKDDLTKMVRKLISANAPLKDATALKSIIDGYDIEVNISDIANNELRVQWFDPTKHVFNDGDDAVRWICYAATSNAMLIKSPEVIGAVQYWGKVVANISVLKKFLSNHTRVLANVFNRHKKIIMSLKGPNTRSEINLISRLSKKLHKPIPESFSKNFLVKAINGELNPDAANYLTVREKFKMLNLLQYKKEGLSMDVFTIRNGKVHLEEDRKIWPLKDIARVEKELLASLAYDLQPLKDKKILLDDKVAYGLPVSRKQSLGHLPYGTTIDVSDSEQISSGIYWTNEMGANDLDLSTINTDGSRTGWGQYSGYDGRHGVTYSGDMTYASPYAMEFMTSKTANYGLFVNIYSGRNGSECELVVGGHESTKDQWIDSAIIRERVTLESRGSILGFVQNKEFVVWQGRMNNNSLSGARDQAIIKRGMINFWTVPKLFNELGIDFSVDNDPEVDYDYNLKYGSMTYDDLEALLQLS